jgi:hypothetical protein
MKRLIILFAIISISSSCGINRNLNNINGDSDSQIDTDYEEVIESDYNYEPKKEYKISKKEGFILGMWMLFEFYIRASAKSPTCAKDLILWIESIDEDSQLVYFNEYRYLKKNEKKLVFVTETEESDSETMWIVSVYNKKVLHKNGLFKIYVYINKE